MEEMITSFEKLMDLIMWDWPDDSWQKNRPKIQAYVRPRYSAAENGYCINKTYIFQENDKYWLEYKIDQYELSSQVFEKFEQFYILLYEE